MPLASFSSLLLQWIWSDHIPSWSISKSPSCFPVSSKHHPMSNPDHRCCTDQKSRRAKVAQRCLARDPQSNSGTLLDGCTNDLFWRKGEGWLEESIEGWCFHTVHLIVAYLKVRNLLDIICHPCNAIGTHNRDVHMICHRPNSPMICVISSTWLSSSFSFSSRPFNGASSPFSWEVMVPANVGNGDKNMHF